MGKCALAIKNSAGCQLQEFGEKIGEIQRKLEKIEKRCGSNSISVDVRGRGATQFVSLNATFGLKLSKMIQIVLNCPEF